MAEILQPPHDEEVEEALYEPEAPTYTESDYRDWDDTTAYVISGPIGETKFKGERFVSWRQASDYVATWAAARGKKVYQFWTITGRWFARVSR